MRKTLKFPPNFLWGTATAGHQVEGNNIHSDWWHWERKNKDIENSGIACDHYNKYKTDFRLAKNFLNNNAHRLSIEWARIEPQEGKIDKKEVDHYKNVLKELKKQKLKSMVTLHHFVNPYWFSKRGGFEKRKNTDYFERHVEFCVEIFGDLIDYWIIINEPNIYVGAAYLTGIWPPNKRSFYSMTKVYLNLINAHKKAYKVIHQKYPNALVGSAIHMLAFNSFTLLDKVITKLGMLIFNDSFLLLTRRYHDFIGINYYGLYTNKIRDFLLKKFDNEEFRKFIQAKRNDLGWPVYPPGIFQVVVSVWKQFNLPIIITENGTADAHDPNRTNYIKKHLVWLYKAIRKGADVKGYYYWSLMDNFEWKLGRDPRFGLFEVDYDSLKRIPRKSAELFSQISEKNSLVT